MSEEQVPQQENEKKVTKGILLTISETGRCQSQIMGTLNEAEFLGLGAYLSNVLIKDGLVALSQNQMSEMEALNSLVDALKMMREGKEEEDKCGQESCSGDCHSQASGPSLESSQTPSRG